jgi:hypothetical protein
MLRFLDLIGLIAIATLFGSMVFFSTIVAPRVFMVLDAQTAGRLIRALFPWYYLAIIAMALLAAAALAPVRPLDAALTGLIALTGLASRQLLMPRINHVRDKMNQGEPGADRRFIRLHRLSVWINGAQLALAFAVLIRLGLD